MDKTVLIDGKSINFRMNASFAYAYEGQFGEDIFQVLFPLLGEAAGETDFIKRLSLKKIQNIIWTMAKLYDDSIDEPKVWFASFECFLVDSVVPELLSLFLSSFVSKKKSNLTREAIQ